MTYSEQIPIFPPLKAYFLRWAKQSLFQIKAQVCHDTSRDLGIKMYNTLKLPQGLATAIRLLFILNISSSKPLSEEYSFLKTARSLIPPDFKKLGMNSWVFNIEDTSIQIILWLRELSSIWKYHPLSNPRTSSISTYPNYFLNCVS